MAFLISKKNYQKSQCVSSTLVELKHQCLLDLHCLCYLFYLFYLCCLCSALNLLKTTLLGLRLSGLVPTQTSLGPETQREVPCGFGPPSPQLPTFWYPAPQIYGSLVALNSDLCLTCLSLNYSSRNYSPLNSLIFSVYPAFLRFSNYVLADENK